MNLKVLNLISFILGFEVNCLMQTSYSMNTKDSSEGTSNRDRVFLVFSGFSIDTIEKALAEMENKTPYNVLRDIRVNVTSKTGKKKFFKMKKNKRKRVRFDSSSSSSSSSSESNSSSTEYQNFPYNPPDQSYFITYNDSRQVITNYTETKPALRFGSSCSKSASKACAKSCKNVLKTVCDVYKCGSDMKGVFRKECAKNCRLKFKV